MPRRIRINKAEKNWYKVDSKKGVYYTNVVGYKNHRFIVKKDGKPNPAHLLEAIEKLEVDHGSFSSVYGLDGVYTVDVKKKENEVELPSGTYNFMKEDYITGTPERLVPVDFRTDKYIKLPNSKSDEIVKELKIFLDSEDLYKELNCIYKSGFLLYGKPGEGKTALLRSIVREELPKDCVVININDVLPTTQFLTTIKETLKDRLKIFILEEFSHFCKDAYDMETILTFLDGEDSINKSVIFATTNYPEVLPGNIVERHSRFDHLYEITSPDANSRKLLLDYYMGKEVTEEEIKLTQDFSSDSIKNLCILARKKKISIKEASDKVKQHLKVAKDNFRKVGKLGI